MTVHPGFIGKVPQWHHEAYILAPAAVHVDAPIQPLLAALICASPLFWAAILCWILL